MKKSILSLLVLATSLVACTDDYTDWSAPQHNDQPATVQFGNGSVTEVPAINLADVVSPTVKVASITAPTADSGYEGTGEYKINLAGKTLDITAAGEVKTDELQSLIVEAYGKAPEQRDIDATIYTWFTNSKTTVKKTVESAAFKVKATPKAAAIEPAYYLAGDMFENGWTKAGVQQFSHSTTNVWDDPTFKIKVTATDDGQTFMIVPASCLEKGNILDGAFGCQNEGDDSSNGTLVNSGAYAITIPFAGDYIITINMESHEYTVAEAPKDLYMTGSGFNNWNSWHKLVPYNGSNEVFWTIIYCAEGDQFKFAPQAGWDGGDFGYNEDVEISAADVEKAGITTNNDHNIIIGKTGWYLLRVTNGSTRRVEFFDPEIYLVGETSSTGWTSCDPTADKLFTIPTAADGQFVSPTLSNTGKFRAYVKFSDTTPENNNWWKAEFSLTADGGFQYRGRNGDGADVYPCLEVEAGKKVYLNFATGKTEVK